MSSLTNSMKRNLDKNKLRRVQNNADKYKGGKLSKTHEAYLKGDYNTVINNKAYGYAQNGIKDTHFTGGRSKKNYKDIQEGNNPYQAKYFKPSIKSRYYVEPYTDKEGNKVDGFYSNKRRLDKNEVLARRLYGNNVTPTTLFKARETKDRLNNYSIVRSYNANANRFTDNLNTPKLDGLRVARNKGGGLNYLVGGAKDFLADPIVDFLKLIDAPESALMSGALGLVDTGVDLFNVPFGNKKLSEVNWDSARENFNKSLDSSKTTGWGDSASEGLKKINETYQENEIREAQRMGYDVDAIRRRQQENKAKVDTFMTVAGTVADILNPIDVGGKAINIGKGVTRLAKNSKNAGIISDPEIYETFSKLADRVENISKGSKKSGLGMDLQTLAKKPETQETAEFLSDVSGISFDTQLLAKKSSKKSTNLYKFKNYDDTISALERVRNNDELAFRILDNIDDENIEDDVFDYISEKYPELFERYMSGESNYADEFVNYQLNKPLNDLVDAHKNKQIDYVDENGNVVDTLNKNSKSIEYNKWADNIRSIARKNQSRQSNLNLPTRRNFFNNYIGAYSDAILKPTYISKTGITRYDDTVTELTKLKRANISATEKVRYLNEILFKGETVISPSISKQTVKNILDIFIDINKSAKGVVSGKPIEELSDQTLNYLKRVYKTKELPTEINSQTIFSDLKKMAENYSKSYVDKSYWDKLDYKNSKLGKNAVNNAFARKSQIYSSGKVSPELTKELQRLQSIIDEGKKLDLEIDNLDDFDEYLKTNNKEYYDELIEKRKTREKELAGRQSRNNIINKVLDELDEDSSFKKVGRDDTPESILKSIQEEYSPEGSPVKFLDSYDDVVKYHNYKAKPLQYEADMKYQQRLLNYNGDDINSYKGNEEFLLNSQEIQEMLNYEKLMKERAPRINNHVDANGEYIRFSTKQAMEHPDVQHNIINYVQSLEREVKELLSNNSVGKLGYKSNRHTSAQNDYLDALNSFNNTMVTFKNSDFYSYRKDILNNIFKEYPNLKSSVGDTDFYKYVNIVAKDKYVRDLVSKYSSLYDTLINHFPNLNIKQFVGNVSDEISKIFDMLSKEKKIAGEILANSKKIQNKSYKLQNMLKITSPKFSKAGSDIIPANVELNKKNLWKIVVNEVDMAKKNPELYKEYKDAFSYLRKQYFGGLKTQRISESELENITNIVNEKLKEIPTIKERNEELVKDVFSKLKNKIQDGESVQIDSPIATDNKPGIDMDLQLLSNKDKKIKPLKGKKLYKYVNSIQTLDLNKQTVKNLKIICQKLGIKKYYKKNKKELIWAIDDFKQNVWKNQNSNKPNNPFSHILDMFDSLKPSNKNKPNGFSSFSDLLDSLFNSNEAPNPFKYYDDDNLNKNWYHDKGWYDMYRRWLNTYKRGVTVYNPGWHLANFLQNKGANYYALGLDAFKPQKKASKILDVIQGKSSELPDIITKDGNNIDANKIIKYAIDNGIVDGMYNDVQTGGRAIFPKLDNYIDNTKLMKKLSRNEQTARLHHFITQIENGKSFEEAHKSVNKYLFDYGRQSSFDKFMSDFIDPFWVFHKNGFRFAGETALKNPHRVGNVMRAERGMQNGVDEEERNNNASETSYQLPYGSYNDSKNDYRYDMMYKQNMFITPTNIFPGDYASIEGKMNPLLKLAIQQYRGKGNWNTDVVDGEPGFNEISRDEKKKEVVANFNPILNNFFTNLNKSKTYEEREQSQETIDKQKMMLWLNYVTGGKFNYQRNIDWL